MIRFLTACLLAFCGVANAATYLVGFTGPPPAGSTVVATMQAVPWASLAAGSRVVISPGGYAGITTINGAAGTRAAPITITAADPAQPPVLSNSIDFQRSSYVQLSHVAVQNPTFAGVIIRQASSHITVADSAINGAPVGISITEGAGTGHQILRNTISDSLNHGISADRVNGDPNERTLIRNNTITRSGQHGMEIRASYHQIEFNTVSLSGQATGGASGIHLYSGAPTENSGDFNVVRFNRSFSNSDTRAADGNGIEADQWCDSNLISYNVVWGNDGAGIISYDGSNNLLDANTAYGNGLDPARTHGDLGQIIVSGTRSSTAVGNRVTNNLLASTRAKVPAMFVDSRAVTGGTAVGSNAYSNSAAGPAVRWGDGLSVSAAALIDQAIGGVGSAVMAPDFVDSAHPLADGLRLSTQAAAAIAAFGAYYTPPAVR